MEDIKKLKIPKSKLRKFDQSIQDFLNVSFSNPTLISDLKTTEAFKQLVEKALNMNLTINKLLEKESSENSDLVKKYNSLTNSRYKAEEFKFSDEHDWSDEIKYFDVYLQNVYKKKLSDFSKEPTENVSENSADSTNTKNNFQNNEKETINLNQTSKNPGAAEFINRNIFGMGAGAMGAAGLDSGFAGLTREQNAFLLAQKKIQEDVIQNKFYLFKTKPVEIKIIKYLIIAFYAIISISSFITALFIFLNLAYKFEPEVLAKIYNVKEVQSGGSVFSFQFVFVPLLFLFLSAIGIFRMVQGFKNDNNLYYLNARQMLFIAALILVFSLMGFLGSGFTGLTTLSNSALDYFLNGGKIGDNLVALEYFKGIYYTSIISLTALAIVLVLYIIGNFYNPKRDFEAYENKVNQYVNEFLKQN